MVGVPPSCAALGGFEIGARVALLWQHIAKAKWERVLTRSMPGLSIYAPFWELAYGSDRRQMFAHDGSNDADSRNAAILGYY